MGNQGGQGRKEVSFSLLRVNCELSLIFLSELEVRIDFSTLRVLVRKVSPLSYWNSNGEQGRNFNTSTPDF